MLFLYEQDLISWSVYSMNIRNFIYFLNNFYELKIVLVNQDGLLLGRKKALMFEKSTIVQTFKIITEFMNGIYYDICIILH